MSSLEVQALTKEFEEETGHIVAVDNIDLAIDDEEFIVLVGPSGCGKSTTLRLIAGLERPTNGTIRLDGESINNRKPKSRDIAMVFQNYALYPHMTVRENMGFGLKMTTDLPQSEIQEQVEETAKLLDITPLLDRRPKELSGGQQQRVALGRAIVRQPKLFLMDEPLSNLDAKLRTGMRTELQQLQNELGITTLYVTHDQTEAMTMGDRIVVFNDGQLQQVGTPLECYYEPNNRFVASFIGSPSMNFFDVQKEINDTGLVLHNEAFTYQVSNPSPDLKNAPKELTLGVRPESIVIADDDATNAIQTTADVVEPMGNINYVYFSLANQTRTVSLPGEQLISEGRKISFVFPQDHIHIFDAETGETIQNCKFTPEVDDFEGQIVGSQNAEQSDNVAVSTTTEKHNLGSEK